MALTTAAVIPARDEAATLAETLDAMQTTRCLSRVVVVDDGSRDATPAIARRFGADLISTSAQVKARGKGGALKLPGL